MNEYVERLEQAIDEYAIFLRVACAVLSAKSECGGDIRRETARGKYRYIQIQPYGIY